MRFESAFVYGHSVLYFQVSLTIATRTDELRNLIDGITFETFVAVWNFHRRGGPATICTADGSKVKNAEK